MIRETKDLKLDLSNLPNFLFLSFNVFMLQISANNNFYNQFFFLNFIQNWKRIAEKN